VIQWKMDVQNWKAWRDKPRGGRGDAMHYQVQLYEGLYENRSTWLENSVLFWSLARACFLNHKIRDLNSETSKFLWI
jgi:hypothetical protein